jgi:hypothetical protein
MRIGEWRMGDQEGNSPQRKLGGSLPLGTRELCRGEFCRRSTFLAT